MPQDNLEKCEEKLKMGMIPKEKGRGALRKSWIWKLYRSWDD